MKTIEISDEMYASLMELSKEIANQDHRATAMPYFFQIQTKELIHVPEGNGTMCWVYDGVSIESEEEINQALYEWKSEAVPLEEIAKMDEFEKESMMEEAGYWKAWYDHTYKYQNSFFTAKGCKQHIKENHYHYTEPTDYLNHAGRNPEMELVMKFLCELSGGEFHR